MGSAPFPFAGVLDRFHIRERKRIMNEAAAGHSMYPGKNRWARKVSPERHARNAARLTYHLRLSMQQAVISDSTARSDSLQ